MAVSVWSVSTRLTPTPISYSTVAKAPAVGGMGSRLGMMTVTAIRDGSLGTGSSGPPPAPTTLQIWPRV